MTHTLHTTTVESSRKIILLLPLRMHQLKAVKKLSCSIFHSVPQSAVREQYFSAWLLEDKGQLIPTSKYRATATEETEQLIPQTLLFQSS